MLIPANFAIGALVGAAASYVYKDDTAKEVLSSLGSKVKGGLDSAIGLLKQKPEVEESVISGETSEDVVAAEQSTEDVMAEKTEDNKDKL